MLGYVRPLKMELRMREWYRYRAVYCAVCKALGREIGQVERMALSFDASFLALFCMSFDGSEAPLLYERCVVSPFKPHPIAAPTPLFDFVARLSAYLVYAKGRDDWQDGEIWRALPERLFFAKGAKRFAAQDKALYEALEAELAALHEFERTILQAKPPEEEERVREQALKAASFNGRALGLILEVALSYTKQSEPLEHRAIQVAKALFESLGRWIYLIDALEDQAEDGKKGRPNPLRGLKDPKPLAALLLENEERQMDQTASLLPYQKDGDILHNVLCLGLPQERLRVLAGEKQERAF